MYLSATDLSLRQTHVLDSNSKNAWALFEVTYGGSTYYWSNFSSKSYGGNTYTFKIRGFTDIDIGYAGGDFGLIAPSEFYTEIDNAGNTLSPSDLAGATLTLRLIMSANLAVQPSGGDATIESGVTLDNSHDDVQEDQIRAWRFNAAHVSPTGLQSLKVQWEPFHLKYLRQDFPTGKLAHDEFPDDTGLNDTYCIPKIYGTAYIPLRSVYKTDKRYYLLGASGVTYTVSEVRAPRDWSDQTWASGSYTFTDDTIAGRSGTNYKASRFLIAASTKDGPADANGLFYQGSKFLDVLAKFSASDTASMTSPGSVIENFMEALGVPSAEINDTAIAAANVTYSARSIIWSGGYWYKQDAEKVLADMCIQCDSDIVVRDTLILRPRDNTPKLTVETNLMLVDGSDEDTYRCYPVNQQDYRDSCHVAYRPTGEPMDSLLKIIVPADTATDYPADHTYEMPLVHDSQVVQKLGTLAAQRKLNRKYEITFMADPKILQLEVGDVFNLAHANYGGPVRVLITGMTISSELDIRIKGTIFSTNLKSWSDLSPGAVTPATDDSTSYYRIPLDGPDDPNKSGSDQPNAITERMRIVDGANLIVEGGGDIILDGSNTDPGVIKFYGTAYNVEIGGDADGDRFAIVPDNDAVTYLYIGCNLEGWWQASTTRFKDIYVRASSEVNIMAGDPTGSSPDYCAFIRMDHVMGEGFIELSIYDEGSERSYTFDYDKLAPSGNKVLDLGAALNAFDDAYADDFNNVADFFHLDDRDDLAELEKILGSGRIDERTGLELIDDNTLPDWLLAKDKKTGQILRGPDGRPYIALKTIISLLMGCIRQLNKKVKNNGS